MGRIRQIQFFHINGRSSLRRLNGVLVNRRRHAGMRNLWLEIRWSFRRASLGVRWSFRRASPGIRWSCRCAEGRILIMFLFFL